MTTKPPTLADDVLRWSFQTKLQRTLPERCLQIQARYRAALRQAQRFVVDDDAVRLVCHLSHEQKRLEAWSFLARIPYNNFWVEFSLHEKVLELDRMGSLRNGVDLTQVSPVMGLLFYLDGDATATRWICHMFTKLNDGTVTPDVLAFVLDPEGSPLNPLRGSLQWRAPTLSLRPDFPKIPIRVQFRPNGKIDDPVGMAVNPEDVTYEKIKVKGRLLTPDIFELDDKVDPEISLLGLWAWNADTGLIESPDWLTSRTAVIIEPWFEALTDTSDKARQHRTDIAFAQCDELAGQFRWILTLLAAINGLPKNVKPVHSAGRQTVGMRVLPYLQHSTITINLPREDRIRRARVLLDRTGRNARRPWHQVIGHWRVIERGKPLPGYFCRHVPAMVEHGLGMCEKCEMLVRWIPAHSRGDPNIGMVDHTYNVHGKRRTPDVELGVPPND
jgi:hypothetical protein